MMNSNLFKVSITIFILTINKVVTESNNTREFLEDIKNETYIDIHKNFPNIFCSRDIILDYPTEISSQHEISEEDPGYIWRIVVPEDNHQILMHFQYIIALNNSQKNCEENYIEVRNGLSSKAPLIQHICDDLPLNIHSIGRELYVKLVNNDANSSLQFSAYLNNVVDKCHHSVHDCEHQCINTFQGYRCSCNEGFTLDSNQKNCISNYKEYGSINHQMCENTYDTDNYRCSWKILAPENYRIILNFTHFNLDEEHSDFYNCSTNNYLKIIEKLDNHAMEIEGPYCGTELPSIRLSESNRMGIEFITNKNTLNSEFTVNYHVVKDECAFNNGGCPHQCRKTINSFKCFSCIDFDASDDYE